MIAYLSGNALYKTARALILDIRGVGYEVNVPLPLLEKAELHLPLELHVHTQVREDELSLYGFETREELRFFKMLIDISGVGPRLAMDLFTLSVDTLKKAILENNVAGLTQMKGIGKKTAERIILELKEKIATHGYSEGGVELMAADTAVPDDVITALQSLGYLRKDVTRVFRSLSEPLATSEDFIRYFLKNV